ncbi:tetratricopeptide repeat protein [Erythrobacter sp. SCSIO 43205]|uniref:tetratricopeptide repeat protein n=1 Tax=Erythrobacter sp. SCSIO 43205 TaxID=2779361 RepID=UPI001CA96E90|nr:tetratricopeptide repeat protein [Erythrobacter sp. SCSIO 43205]UAB78040.1 tetratricopeptide repeat protein [Erythrobacter sp. SCSIO 43205]
MGDNLTELPAGEDQSGAQPSSRESSKQTTNPSGGKAGWVLLGGAALLAVASIGYNVYSGGEDSTQDVASADGTPSIEELRAAAEAADDDAGPWSELGFAHFERGEFAEAVDAYERAVAIDDSSAFLWSALGEARVMAVDAEQADADPLPPAALEAFAKAVELDANDPRGRYFLAVKKDIDGDHEGALAGWLALLEDTPVGAPWESDVVRTIQQVAAINEIDVEDRLSAVMSTRTPEIAIPGSGQMAGDNASANVRGPTAQQVNEARQMSASDQEAMIAGMVESLETRLEDDPSNLDGWVMLMRSRMTLGERGKAREALNKAVAANPGNADELRRQAAQLGIE